LGKYNDTDDDDDDDNDDDIALYVRGCDLRCILHCLMLML